MDQHVLHVYKVFDVDHALHSRVLEESILDDLDRPDILSDDNQTFDLQGVLRDLRILALNVLCVLNIVEDRAVMVSYHIVLESISDNLELPAESYELYDASMMSHPRLR